MNEAVPEWSPAGIDPAVPTTARVYDAILGGRDNFKADREAADVFTRRVPQAREAARLNRAALIRGVRYMVRWAGIDQILDIGCGLPTEQNTHEAAQEINPGARVVYVDNDPMVLSHGRALLVDNRTTTVVTADMRDPAGILANPEVRANLDFDRPIGLMLVGMIMHIAGDESPDEIIGALMEPLASGSHLFLTAWPDTGDPAQHALSQASLETLGTGWARPVERIRGHFLGMPLVPPGLEYVPRWYPEEPDRKVPAFDDFEPYERTYMAGIAVKP
ncbi:SAM-dependent methyltransferase [Glycomyces sp. TRM65418]|uniref:SAM-dependent methyltransferase n=1 Tax=Glycomyces sp. TRM65418 TaxID=2867006 RepID=UPI001CE521A4|nr:SAM-dependent methyltransferase [Glycomyces sp. TRM65418]MCC3765045.1 SAM-dependent methyltransferase [Glycomyces sp. TRM65418]QZD54675.1 SAM-dependent methyltransferase [Glycomyces sp. TRM65418]